MTNGVTETDFSQEGLWPSLEQECLLRAALLEKDKSIAAYEQWRSHIDIDDEFDRGTFRLLPLLYHNMHRHGLQDPLVGRLKGIYRMAWYENHKLFHDMRPVLEKLDAAGIKTLILKGAPLTLEYYKNYAVRPMSDIDVLVPTAEARRTVALLESWGWQRHYLAQDEDLEYRHAMQFSDNKGRQFDLHWHVLFECCQSEVDAPFWAAARELDYQGVPTSCLNGTHALFHIVIHGVCSNPEPPIRWIPDASIILNTTAGQIDWDEIVKLAKKLKLTHRLYLGLSYLKVKLDASIPEGVLQQLKDSRTSLVEHIENTCILRDRVKLYENPLGNLWLIFAEYYRYSANNRPNNFITGFSHYLRYRWRLRGRSEIFGVIVRGLFRRMKRLLTGVNEKMAPSEHQL